ncbi:unnamed protein product [Eruca vesicaria subsp. sativa]|uniref:Protein kinase domain-containing protein n=1 Tax=Eruca vesicaria subsp. sativa TaxID=29727 RepID=A0ABC8M051_ERUVS|nr:unnamed protein product [Eruca vesicaria subsp. sativa]
MLIALLGNALENVEGDIIRLKDQAAELQNFLILKERETLEVVKKLDATKATIKELINKQQKKNDEEETLIEEVDGCIKPAGVVPKDISKANMNMCKKTVDLAGKRGSVEVLNSQLQAENTALEKTCERLTQKERLWFAKNGVTSEKGIVLWEHQGGLRVYMIISTTVSFIHLDVKAANILLDEQVDAVVRNFGLAKLMNYNYSYVIINVCGIIGHSAPEYFLTGKSYVKTDVFSLLPLW